MVIYRKFKKWFWQQRESRCSLVRARWHLDPRRSSPIFKLPIDTRVHFMYKKYTLGYA